MILRTWATLPPRRRPHPHLPHPFFDMEETKIATPQAESAATTPPPPLNNDDDDDGNDGAMDDDVEAFRQKLLSSQPKKKKKTIKKTIKKTVLQKKERKQPQKKLDEYNNEELLDKKNYRLASLFGDAEISAGPDMTEDVVQAVRANGLATEEEDTLIFLSAISTEEMLAIRGLVAKYRSEKKHIVLVNCKLSPTPKELQRAVLAYSLTPLIIRSVDSSENLFGGSSSSSEEEEEEEEGKQPKIVVMLRYPGDWEIYIDVEDGQGFELAKTMPANRVGKTGPSIDVLVSTVKQHLQSKELGQY